MIYQKRQQDDGDYTDADGVRWIVNFFRRVRTPEGVNVGWTEFPSLEAALEAWGLIYEPRP